MDSVMNKGKRKEENERVLNEDLKDFERMRHTLTDIVSNKVFKNGIILPEDRELLRIFWREIKDVIHDIETVPLDTFDIVSKQNLTEKKTRARRQYQNIMKAVNDGGSIASVLKDEDPDRPALFRSSDLLDPDNTSVQSTNSLNAQFNINAGYESDNSSLKQEGKTILKIENKMEGSYRSLASIDQDKKSDQVFYYNKPDLYGGSARYFIDDYEAASTISVSSADNWTLRKSTLSMDTEKEDNDMHRNQNGHYRDSKVTSNVYQYSSKPAPAKQLEKRIPARSTIYDDQGDENEKNDYDDTVIPPAADKRYNNTDVDDVLGDFDYLNDYQSQSDASNISLCGSETSFRSEEKKLKLTDHDRKVDTLVIKGDTDYAHANDKNVNDVLGVFDYLNEYHSRTNSTSTASIYDSDDDIALDNEIIPNTNSENMSEDLVIGNIKTKLNFNQVNMFKGTYEGYANEKGKPSDDSQKELSGYGPLWSDVELNPDYENDPVRPKVSKRKDVGIKNSHTDVDERSTMEDNSYVNIAYGIEDKSKRPSQDSYSAYESNRTSYKGYGSKNTLQDRARSEEVVSGYTHGEFILRRTQSEDQNGAFRQKPRAPLEVVPEDTYPTSVYDESMEYTRNKNPDTGRFDKCDLLIKFVMVILFGIGVTVTIFGTVLREDCKWSESVPICTITYGGVTICYCVIFLGMNMARKRTIEMSRGFRALLVIIWLILLGLIVAGGVILYPSIKDYAFNGCNGEQDCCRRKFMIITLCAIIIDIVCQICFAIGLYCVHKFYKVQ